METACVICKKTLDRPGKYCSVCKRKLQAEPFAIDAMSGGYSVLYGSYRFASLKEAMDNIDTVFIEAMFMARWKKKELNEVVIRKSSYSEDDSFHLERVKEFSPSKFNDLDGITRYFLSWCPEDGVREESSYHKTLDEALAYGKEIFLTEDDVTYIDVCECCFEGGEYKNRGIVKKLDKGE